MRKIEKIKIVILAAGRGTRMGGDGPKVLVQLRNKPLIKHLLESVRKSNVDNRPVVVVGYEKEKVIKELGSGYEYVAQKEQLGTGHAVMSVEKLLKNSADHILVINGDMPFTSPKTISNIINHHVKEHNNMTMGTVVLKDFKGWREAFYSFGRIARDKNGNLEKIVYGKNLTSRELGITEVDPAYFCFRTDWLWPRLHLLKNENSHKEYYLTDLVGIAVAEGNPPKTIQIPPGEALGVNSKYDLEILEKLAK